MHRISALADLSAKALAEKFGDIWLVVDHEDACATRRLPSGEAHAHAAAPVLAAYELRGRRTVNSVNSPTRLSTSIVPPCCWVHDVVADREAQPGALSGWLCREERLEQLVLDLGRDAGAVVTHPHLDRIAVVARCHREDRPE